MSHQKTVTSGYKVTNTAYIDLSDYARPLAVRVAQALKNTRIHVYHITIAHFTLSLVAAFFIAQGSFFFILIAVILLLLKNLLDAVDGSLARIRSRPSRVGRFLDSNLDFVGNFLLFFALVDIPLWIRVISFFSFLIQGSFFNYFYILFRNSHDGDTTSKIKEDDTSSYPYDNRTALRILYFFYSIFYQWQDNFVTFIDQRFRNKERTISSHFISYMSIHGLGFQQLIIILLLLTDQRKLIPIWFSFLMNIYLVIMLIIVNKGPTKRH